MTIPTLYILYNANSTLLGKLNYARRKIVCNLTSSSTSTSTSANTDAAGAGGGEGGTGGGNDMPPCAACEITHGGLRLNESETWKEAKGRIFFFETTKKKIGGEIKQLHRDEVDGDGDVVSESEMQVKNFIKKMGLRYPMVLYRGGEGDEHGGDVKLLMTAEELAACKGDPGRFLDMLAMKGKDLGVGVGVDAPSGGNEDGNGNESAVL